MFLSKVQAEVVRLDPHLSFKGTSLLGRMVDVLARKGMKVNSFAIDESLSALAGELSNVTRVSVKSAHGFQKFSPSASNPIPRVDDLNDGFDIQSNILSETWSSSLVCHSHETLDIYLIFTF